MNDKTYNIRALTLENTHMVGSLFRAVYGNDYPYNEVYQPEQLSLEIKERRLRAFLAVDPAGRPVGYFAQARTAPNPKLWEEKGLVVAPEYKYTQLALALINHVWEAELSADDGIFNLAVCHHYFTQMVCTKNGRSDCALGLNQVDSNIFKERQRASDTWQVALLLEISETTDPIAPLYLPPEYADILYQLARPLRPRVFKLANEPLPTDRLTVITDKHLPTASTWRVSVQEVGADWPTVLAELLENAGHCGIISLQVTLNAHHPSLGAAVRLMRHKGFFFSGLAPRWFGTDGIVLQKVLGKEPDYDGIKLYTPLARELLSFIRADREAVGHLA